MRDVLLLLGSNIGERVPQIAWALQELSLRAGTVLRVSGLYETDAWGLEQQPPFVNQAIWLQTTLAAHELLTLIHSLEEQAGRTRTIQWGPRVLDIDILFYGQEVIQTPTLRTPHLMLAMRRFTLVPLAEIAADWVHPESGIPVADLLRQCTDPLTVRPLSAG